MRVPSPWASFYHLCVLSCFQGDDGEVGPRGLPGEPVSGSLSHYTLHFECATVNELFCERLFTAIFFTRNNSIHCVDRHRRI